MLTSSAPWRESCPQLAALVPGPRVLDVGVGPGESAFAPRLGARAPVGLDLFMAVLRRAAGRARAGGLDLPLVRADAGCLPVRTGALDGATDHSVLYLLDDAPAALRELRRAVRPGGRVAFLEPSADRPALGPAWRRGPRFDAAGLSALLAAAGFEAIRVGPALRGFALLAAARR